MGSSDDKRFPPDKAAKLDAPERYERQPPERIVEALELDADAFVLDVGVGTGFFALPIAQAIQELGGEGRVLGADVEMKMLDTLMERARDKGLQELVRPVQVKDPEALRLPLPEGLVDRILAASLYHELPNRPAALQELLRVLRPGCFMLVVDWDPNGTTEAGPPLDHRLPMETVHAELEAAGFTKVRPIPLYDDLYTLRARRPFAI